VFNDPGENVISSTSAVNGDFGEAAFYFSRARFNVVAGGGYFEANGDSLLTIFGYPIPSEIAVTHGNAWVYADGSVLPNLRLTVGASVENYREADTGLERHRINPKFGLIWELAPGSALRATYFEALKRTTVGGQTIEPTQVGGFNQLFDDPAATMARRWGVGFDQKFAGRLFAGVEWSQRQLDVLIPAEQYWREDLARAYLDWLVTDRWSFNVSVQWDRFVRDPMQFNPDNIAELNLTRLPVELRYYAPSGLFASLRTTFVHESGRFRDYYYQLFDDEETFAVVDASVGWRIPGRDLVGSIDVRNLFNSGFRFQDTDAANPTIVRRRLVMGRITFRF